MVLEFITGKTAPSEDDIFANLTTPAWGGGSPPNKVEAELKALGGPPTVVVAQTTGPDAEVQLIRRMAWSVHRKLPPIALVAWLPKSTTGDGHWMVVVDYTANKDPSGPNDAECKVSGLDYNNPMLAAGDQAHPDHVSAKWWRRRYMKPVGDDRPPYGGKFVAVVGP
jgi:hypothetical protein